jgi:hypothetical protein
MKTRHLLCSVVLAASLLQLQAAAQPRDAPAVSPQAGRPRGDLPAAVSGRRSADPDAALEAFARPAPLATTLTEPPSDPLLAFPPAPPPPPPQPVERPERLARLLFEAPSPPRAATRRKHAPTDATAGARDGAEAAAASHDTPQDTAAEQDVGAAQASATLSDASQAAPPDNAAGFGQSGDTSPPTPQEGTPGIDPEGPILANLGATLAWGESLDRDTGGANPLGIGFGVRGEYRPISDLGWVIGGRVLYFLGSSTTVPTGEFATHSWLFAADAGHVFDLRPVWLEPLVAFGLQVRDTSGRPAATTWNGQGYVTGTRSSTQLGFYLAPGLRATLPLAPLSDALQMLYLGVDSQLGLIFAKTVNSQIELLVHGGVRF